VQPDGERTHQRAAWRLAGSVVTVGVAWGIL
jgi:hypothetical protein